jgi:hypothetical protein
MVNPNEVPQMPRAASAAKLDFLWHFIGTDFQFPVSGLYGHPCCWVTPNAATFQFHEKVRYLRHLPYQPACRLLSYAAPQPDAALVALGRI